MAALDPTNSNLVHNHGALVLLRHILHLRQHVLLELLVRRSHRPEQALWLLVRRVLKREQVLVVLEGLLLRCVLLFFFTVCLLGAPLTRV